MFTENSYTIIMGYTYGKIEVRKRIQFIFSEKEAAAHVLEEKEAFCISGSC